nr:tyrosine-type recombinase/integrase [Antrihabitans stalactiti]
MCAYRRFTEQWPDLEAWFAAPLVDRLGYAGAAPLRSNGRTDSHRASAYLVYLSMVKGIGLDYSYLLGRKYGRLFDPRGGGDRLGVDSALFDRWVDRLDELGYSRTKAHEHLMWALGRLCLHRGDADLTAITDDDLFELGAAVRDFAARDDFTVLRRDLFAHQSGWNVDGAAAARFQAQHLAKVHAAHTLLFNVGQVETPPRKGTRAPRASTLHLLQVRCPSPIANVVERYLALRLDAGLDRKQTVRLTRNALRRLVVWLADEHPEVTNLAQLDRKLIEGYMQWLPTCLSTRTRQPLSSSQVKYELNIINAFCRETAVWGWNDVPGRPLLTGRDTPRRPESVPRYLPDHELDVLMNAVGQLTDPLQRAAMLVLRWSGARRDEVRRLTCDCLDSYPDGHPRLRIPVGKGYTERVIPLHPDAAAALQHAIDLARAHRAAARYDDCADRVVDYVFVRRGKLLSPKTLFDEAFRTACTTAGLVDTDGNALVSAHRFRHTVGTQLAEGGARIQTIMAILGHRSAAMSLIYSRISDPAVRRQYEAALTAGNRIAGPAADALLHDKLDDKTVHWLQTNFLKTELELGHCLRLPAEGPCECDLVLTCPKFLTSSEYAPRIRSRLATETKLVEDARERGWDREIERHQATRRRLQHLLDELDEFAEPGSTPV